MLIVPPPFQGGNQTGPEKGRKSSFIVKGIISTFKLSHDFRSCSEIICMLLRLGLKKDVDNKY